MKTKEEATRPRIPQVVKTNHPKPHDDVWRLPDGWCYELDFQIFSRSHCVTILYETPAYTGTVYWHFNCCWGEFAGAFEWEGETLHASSGADLGEKLGIPKDYYVRSGKDGWQKLLTREMFEMWLREQA